MFKDRRLPANEPEKVRQRRLWPRRALAIAAAIALAALLVLYAARRTIARESLTAWLRSQGVEAAAEVQALGPTGGAGSLIVGDPRRPDFSVERVELGYGLTGRGLQVRSIRLVRPVLRARLHDGRFSAGALDRLIEQLRKGPPQPNAPKPAISVEGGRVLLATDYGPVEANADALVAEGRLQRLAARSRPTRLAGPGFDVSLGAASLTVQSAGAATELSLDAPVVAAAAGQLSAAAARLRITAVGPYPEAARLGQPQPVAAHVELSGGRLAFAGQTLRNGLLSAALSGEVSGGLQDLSLVGRASADLRAAGGEAAGGVAGPLRAVLNAEDLRWTRHGGEAVAATIAATADLDAFRRQDARLDQASVALHGPVALDRRGARFDLAAAAQGRGGWSGLGAPAAGESADIVALRRAAGGFRFAAPGLALHGADGRVGVRLLEPVRLSPNAGGAVTLAPAGSGWRLATAGGGLPKIEAEVRSFRLLPGGAAAAGRIRAGLSIGPVQRGDFDAAGTLRVTGAETSFESAGCARLAAARLDFGGHDVTKFQGRLCPAGRPLVSLGHGDWRIAGRARDVAGEVPFLDARLAQAAGPVELGSRDGRLDASARFTGRAADAAAQMRFRPVAVAGQAQLADGLWTSAFTIQDGAGRQIAQVRLKHEDASGRGAMTIDTGTLRFAQGGLQPAALSPLAAAIGSPVEGEARFSGAFAWTPKTATSSGVLEVPGLDFQSPAGKVSGLSGKVVFNSLAPLTAAPGQTLHAASIATGIASLREARASFGLRPEALDVGRAQADVGGGVIRIENLRAPLASGQPIRGVLHLDGVQLHDLVEGSPFGDRVELDARVSGSIPFTLAGDKVRVSGGVLRAVQPGRLSIQRKALTAVETSGGGVASGAPATPTPEPSTDAFSDFAYQAMENLAFTTLSATVDSRPNGRLGVIFHIVGKHDPPQPQRIRIPLSDLIAKKFLRRKLPLPSGTGVDLTLDTTLNLDDLLADYAEFRRLHGSAQVQP
jgi:hypothetical protein